MVSNLLPELISESHTRRRGVRGRVSRAVRHCAAGQAPTLARVTTSTSCTASTSPATRSSSTNPCRAGATPGPLVAANAPLYKIPPRRTPTVDSRHPYIRGRHLHASPCLVCNTHHPDEALRWTSFVVGSRDAARSATSTSCTLPDTVIQLSTFERISRSTRARCVCVRARHSCARVRSRP